VGDAAPPLSLEAWVGSSNGLPDAAKLGWLDLEGKIVVLEFSGAWAGAG
jgi:hypothetical protein